MAAFVKRYAITAIGANSVTLTPLLGAGGTGTQNVTATLATSDPDLQGGHSTLVLNFTGTPDNKVFPRLGSVFNIEFDGDAA